MELDRRKMLLSSALTIGSVAGSHGIQNHAIAREAQFEEFTASSRFSIRKGTNWLLKAINKDGGAGGDIGAPSDVACTSVVGLALLSQGFTPTQGDLSIHQRKIEKFIFNRVENMTSTGKLQSIESQIEYDLGYYAVHFFTTMYLSSIIGEGKEVRRCQRSLQRLARFISGAQTHNGSWGSEAWAPLLATACGWVSLRAANFAGVKVTGSSDKAGNYLIKHMPRLGLKWGGESWYHRLYGTAAGLRVLYAMQREKEEKAQQALKDIQALLEKSQRAFGGAGGEEYLTFHLLTEMFLQKGGAQWQRWYSVVRNKLVDVQNSDGSWTGHHCITSRTFSTACALLVLSAPNRYLPISQI